MSSKERFVIDFINYRSAMAIAAKQSIEPINANVLTYGTPIKYVTPCTTLKISHQQAYVALSIPKYIDAKTSARKGAKLSCKFKEALLALFNKIDADGELSLTPIIQCKFLISIAMGINQD